MFPKKNVLSINQCNVPILMIIEALRDYIQRSFDEPSLTIVATLYVEMVLHKSIQNYVRWQATKIPSEISSPLLSNIYRAFHSKKSCVVDLNRHTYSCGKCRSLGIGCDHVTLASRYSKIHELPDMVQIYYQADVFQTAY
uniref:SWIM-type domain-containing protein n=1 Tax=Lactuca sativa TaxID=4236 RepID=A0A9R1XLT4_LACSA|nr:hypothetical protein LSAT_V11C400181900 [Lactuca sativa]